MLFSLLFRKYPLFRAALYGLLFVIAILIVSVVTTQSKKVPAIENINPSVGSAGETMTIKGANFGNLRETSYVEISGNRITASGYVEWSDEQIKIIIPSNVQDGLVNVVTSSGKSKPAFFANESGIPIEAPPDTKLSLPVITSISPSSGLVGSLVKISGLNFGSVRGNSAVLFSAGKADVASGDENLLSISGSDFDFDYESWSDSEIRVRIPDGAETGTLFVKTDKGVSGTKRLEVKNSVGKKTFALGKTYALKLDEDIDSITSTVNANITLRVPRPIVSASQPSVELNDCSPEPLVADFKNTLIHQIEVQKSDSASSVQGNIQLKNSKYKFTENFVVTAYSVNTEVNPKSVRAYDKNKILYKEYTSSDTLIDCEDSEIAALAKKIIGTEKNPYLQAKLIYEYLLNNYRLLMKVRSSDSNPKSILESKEGDAYDFSIIYTQLLRSLKIPSVSVAGILVNADSSSKNHWWNEFYLEGYGWVPVDIALGIGLQFSPFRRLPVDSGEYYFGNLDNQHIAFSRGWNEIKQSLLNGKVVYRPRTFAFQSIWEESSEGGVNYSSLWNNPIVLGIY